MAVDQKPPARDVGAEHRTPWWEPVVAIATPTALVGAHAVAYGRWIVDDAAITFAYARSVANGSGPVLQTGSAPVEGYSNPAWLALLAAGHRLRLFDSGDWFGIPDYVAFPKFLALVCCALIFGAFYVVARGLTRWPIVVTMVAGAIVAAIPSFVIWCFSGLENALLAAAVAWIAATLATATNRDDLLSPRVAIISGLLAALAALTRPDGLIWVAAYPLGLLLLLRTTRFRRKVRPALIGLCAFIIPVGAYALWRFATFGLLVPNTAVAKAQGLPGLRNVARPFELIVFSGVAPALLGLGLVTYALRRRSDKTSGLKALVLILTLAALEYALLEADWMGQRRFATPVWTIAAIVIAVAGAHVIAGATRRERLIVTAASALTVVIAGVVFTQSAIAFRRNPTVPVCAVASYAGWTVNEYASKLGLTHGTIVTPDVGGTALVSRMKVVDLAGLTDQSIARRWAADDMAGLRADIFGARPEFIETHDGWSALTGLTEDPRLQADYVAVTQSLMTDGLWVRRDLAAGLIQDGAPPTSDRSLALRRSNPYQLTDPLVSCGRLTAD